jgi:ACT domain-containing protein
VSESAKIDSLVLEHLRYMRGSLDRIEADVWDVKLRVLSVEDQLVNVHRAAAGIPADIAVQHQRMDRIDDRLAKIEKRLDLVTT